MKIKKLVSLFVVLALVLTLFAGCGAAQSGSGNSSGKVTKLEIWSFVTDHLNFYEKMAGIWNEQNPKRQIELVPTRLDWADMHDKFYAALLSGQGVPDLCDVEIGKWPNFMNGEVQFLDLTSYAASYTKDIVDSQIELYSKDGKLYGATSHIGATVMYYNTELLNAAGIDYKTIKTWDDFEKALRTYKEKTGKYMTYCETYGAYQFTYMLAEKGYDLIDADGKPNLNTPQALEVVNLINKWVKDDIIGFIPTGNADTAEGKAAVANGEVAALGYPLWYMGRFTSEMPDLKGKIALAPLPVFDDKSNKSVGLGGTGTVVYKNGKNKDLAADFICWAKMSEEGATYLWTDLGYDPVNTKVWSNLEVTGDTSNKFISYFVSNPFDVLKEIEDGIFTCKIMQNSGAINDYLSATTWNRIYVNKEDPATVLKETQNELAAEAK